MENCNTQQQQGNNLSPTEQLVSRNISPEYHAIPVNNCSIEREQFNTFEQVVAKPLSIISLFFFFQLWFSIPAIVFAYSQGPRQVKVTILL